MSVTDRDKAHLRRDLFSGPEPPSCAKLAAKTVTTEWTPLTMEAINARKRKLTSSEPGVVGTPVAPSPGVAKRLLTSSTSPYGGGGAARRTTMASSPSSSSSSTQHQRTATVAPTLQALSSSSHAGAGDTMTATSASSLFDTQRQHQRRLLLSPPSTSSAIVGRPQQQPPPPSAPATTPSLPGGGALSAGAAAFSLGGGGMPSLFGTAFTAATSVAPQLPTGGVNADWSLCTDEWKQIDGLFGTMQSALDRLRYSTVIIQQRAKLAQLWDAQLRQNRDEVDNSTRAEEVQKKTELAVQHLKKAAVVELQKAVVAAEHKAMASVAAERLRMETLMREFQKQEERPENCWNCGRKAGQACSGCGLARYCGAFCQHKDWSRHKATCVGNNSNNNNQASSGASHSTAPQGKLQHTTQHAQQPGVATVSTTGRRRNDSGGDASSPASSSAPINVDAVSPQPAVTSSGRRQTAVKLEMPSSPTQSLTMRTASPPAPLLQSPHAAAHERLSRSI